jgi:hypothetical protein
MIAGQPMLARFSDWHPIPGVAHSRRVCFRLGPPMVTAMLLIAPSPDALDCANAMSAYNAALAKLRSALGTYQRCIEESNGRDKCAGEIQALDQAHDNFEDALADYTSSCQ